MAQKKHGKITLTSRSEVKNGAVIQQGFVWRYLPAQYPCCFTWMRSFSLAIWSRKRTAGGLRASEPTHSGPPRVGRARRPPVGGLRPGRPATSQLTAGFLTFPRCLLRVVSSTRVDDCGGVQGFKTHPRLGSESSGRQSYGISLIKKLLISAKSYIFMIMSVCREIVKTRKISYLYVFAWKTIDM